MSAPFHNSQATQLDGYQLLHEGALALAECERIGIGIDVAYCREKLRWIRGDETYLGQADRFEKRLRLSALGKAWVARYGSATKFGSGPQLQHVLYVDMKVPSFKKTGSGIESVDEESLLQTGVEGIAHLLRLRSFKKMEDVLSQFLEYQVDGRLWPNFNLHTVTTYRSSATDPNLQNVPNRDPEQKAVCRRAIIPSLGNVLLEIDFSGIEVGIAACYHKDPTMMAYLRDPSSDMHADQAFQLFKAAPVLKRYGLKEPVKAKKVVPQFDVIRQASKNGFVFPQFYGDYYVKCASNLACSWMKLPRIGEWHDGDGGLLDDEPIGKHMRSQGITCLDDFTAHVKTVEDDFWNRRFPVYSRWRKDWYATYQREGSFQMKTGLFCSGDMARNKAVNYPVQGAAFHVLLKTLTWVVRRTRDWASKVVGEVHDSLLIDAAPGEVEALVQMVQRIASDEIPKLWPWIVVPLRVEAKVSEVDGSWAEMRDVEA